MVPPWISETTPVEVRFLPESVKTGEEAVRLPTLRLPLTIVLPLLSISRYLVEPALLVMLKMSTEPEAAWATLSPIAVV